MKVKITESGWENYTGNFGGIDFVDGVSTRDVIESELNRIAASVRVEEAIEGGKQLGAAAMMAENYLNSISTTEKELIDSVDKPIEGEIYTPEKIFSREDLEKIADESGIQELRKIADFYKAKGKSIAELIQKVIDAQPTPA